MAWTDIIEIIIIWYFIALNSVYIILLIGSISGVLGKYAQKQYGHINNLLNSNLVPPTTIAIPLHNEEKIVTRIIQSLKVIDYPNLNIILVNDGSTDNTLQIIDEFCELKTIPRVINQQIPTAQIKNYYVSNNIPNLFVIDKEHSGKSDSLNAALNACRTPLFFTMDADGTLEKQALKLLVFDMLKVPHTVAIGGSVYILNGCEYQNGEILERRMSYRPIIAFQACEYLRAFIFGRTAWNYMGGPLCLSGTNTLLEKEAALEIQGYHPDCIGEDMEIIVRLHHYMKNKRYPCRINYTPMPIIWTQVPDNMNHLWEQRDRWHEGLADSLFKHFSMLFNPRYKSTGLINFPFQLFGELAAPVVEITGYCTIIYSMYVLSLNWQYVGLFLAVSWGITGILTMATTLISIITFNPYRKLRYAMYLLFILSFEQFGFRQVIALSRFISLPRYILRVTWRKLRSDTKGRKWSPRR